MHSRILTAKLQIPRLHNSITPRRQLTARLQAGLDRKLTVISSPAGYGKTTLLSEWILEYQPRVAWLSLDRGDNIPERLYEHLVGSFRFADVNVGEIVQVAPATDTSSSLRPVLTFLINQISALPYHMVLVLDDYELLENATLHADVALLLHNIPSQFHLVIASRSQPPLPLARLRVRNELNEFGVGDMRFSFEETSDFLRRVCGCDLPDRQIKSLLTSTEGWIDGLQMAALSLRGSDMTQPPEPIAEFSHGNRYVVDYLTEEVMNQQPEYVRAFLLQTSILDRLNGSLCQAVTGEVHAQKLLEQLAEQNLFVFAADSHRDWYRYHHLFGKFLELRLRQTQPEMIPELHRRASQWYKRQGIINAAVQHAIAGQDWQSATRLIAAAANAMALKSQYAKFHAYRGEPLDEFSQISTNARADPGQVNLPAEGQERSVAADGSLGGMGAFIAGKLHLLDGQTDRADQVLAEIDLSDPEFASESVKLALIGTFGEMRLQQGKLHLAAATYEPFLDRAANQCSEPFWLDFQRGLYRLYYTWNRLSKIEPLLRQCLATFEHVNPAPLWLIDTLLWLAKIEQARGQEKAADTALHQALTLVQISGEPAHIAQVKVQHVQICLQRDDHRVPFRWFKECGLNPTDPVPYHSQYEYLTLARILIRQHRPDPALSLLKRIFEAADNAGRKGDLIEVLALQALAYEAKGDPKRAFAMLANALCEAEQEGYVRTFIDEGAPMTILLQRAAQQGVTLAYVKDLLSAFSHVGQRHQDPPISVGDTVDPAKPLVEPLSERELEVLRLVAAGRSNQETAELLLISPTTVKKHLSNILGKLNTKNRTEAAAKAQQLHLI